MAASEKLTWVLTQSILIKLEKWSEINSVKLSVLHYIGSLAGNNAFEELMILTRLCLVSGPVLKAGAVHMLV